MLRFRLVLSIENHFFGVFELFVGYLSARYQIGDLAYLLIKVEFLHMGVSPIAFDLFGDEDVVVA